jgi:hypothetical protein
MKSVKKNKDEEASPPLGRPMKGNDRRLQLCIYVPGSVIAMIDDYRWEQQLNTNVPHLPL